MTNKLKENNSYISLVAIVGRPNVGKSTLLNRLIGKRSAIVHETPGVTRDRIYEECEWNRKKFLLVDTGGISVEKEDFAPLVKEQARAAIEEADLILFVVDSKTGLTKEDDEVAKILKRAKKPVLVVSNKVENMSDRATSHEFIKLGFGEPILVSSIHGTGSGDLLDKIVANLPEKELREKAGKFEAAITIVGKPNVGKSSLLNAVSRTDRALISEIPGTTRDSVDSIIKYGERIYKLIDTAGISKTKTGKHPLFYYSYLRALKSIERSNLTLLMVDAEAGINREDQRIANLILDKGNACIILLNKWDLIDSEEKRENILLQLEIKLRFLNFSPLIFISAKTGRGLHKIMPVVEDTLAEYRKRIKTSRLNKWLAAIKEEGHTVVSGTKTLKINYITQVEIEPPSFTFFVNDKKIVKKNYRKFLENRLREDFGFEGTPLRLFFKEKNKYG